MQFDKLSDVKLAGRALIKGWLTGCDDRKQAAVNALFETIEQTTDDEIRLKAFEVLIKADQADLKREEVEIKKQAADDDKRIKLLEILQHLPPGAIGQIESGDAESADVG